MPSSALLAFSLLIFSEETPAPGTVRLMPPDFSPCDKVA
jgi:hypothetical protein